MALRNWWIDCDIDGRKTPLCGGPRARDGGFILRVYQRVDGQSHNVVTLWGHVAYGEPESLILEIVAACPEQGASMYDADGHLDETSIDLTSQR